MPGWIAAALKSGAIGSYTNPNTGQTFTAQSLSNPGITITHPTTTYSSAGGGTPSGGGTNASSAIPSKATSPTVASTSDIAAYNALVAKEAAAASGTPFSVYSAEQAGYTVMPYASAPGGYILLKGGSQYNIYGNPIPASLQAPASVAQTYSNAWNSGSTIVQNALPVDYHTFGTNAQITWINGPHNPEFTLTETLPNGTKFTYSGSVSGVPLGSVLATDQAVDQAWTALTVGVQQINSSPPGTAISVDQGASGLTMNIAPPVAGGSGSTQVITLAPGLTESLPTKITTNGVTAIGTWNNGQFIPTSYSFTNGQKTITINPGSPTALAELESYGYTSSEANSLIQSAGNQPITLTISDNGQIIANTPAQAGWYNINGNAVFVSNPAYIQNELSSGANVSYLGPQSQFTQTQAQAYINGLNAAQQYFTQNPTSYAYIVFNPAYTPTSAGSAGPVGLTPQQGIEEASLAAQLGNAGTSLTPSQNAALLGSLVAAGLTQAQAQQVISSLTPAQIAQLQAGTPYTIYFNTPQGISSSYTPQQASYADWQQYALAQANQQFSPYNTYISPVLTSLGSDINAAGQFLNANVVKPVEQFEQGVLNTPLPSQLSQTAIINRLVPPQAQNPSDTTTYLQAMQEPQLPTTIGSLLSSAAQTFNNALNEYVAQPINNYLVNPIEQWYYNNYQSPEAQAFQNALNAYYSQQINQYSNPNAPGSTPLGYNYYFNPNVMYNQLARFGLNLPGMTQNFASGLVGMLGAGSNYLFGTHFTNPIPTTNTVIPEVQYIGTQLPNTITGYINAMINPQNLPPSLRPYFTPLSDIDQAITNAIINNTAQAAAYLGSPAQTPLGTLYNTAYLGSSIAMPEQAYLYGLGSGAINVGTNYLLGGLQTPNQAFSSGYKFGAATAPLFEGAGALSRILSESLMPASREILALVSETTDPAEKQALLDTLNFVWQHPYVAGTVRLLLRTAPVSSVFGALSTLESYASGVRNPMQLAESFGLGYAGGLAFQGLGEAIGSATGSLSTLARQALAKTGIIAPVEVSTELGEQEAVNALVEELPNNQNLLYNMIDRSIGRFGLDTTPLKSLGVEDLKSIIASNPQFFLDSRAIAEVDIPISVLQRDLQKGAISQDRITTILRMMGVDTNGMDAAAQKELLMNKLATGDVPRYMLTKGYTLGNTFDFLPSDIRNNLENAARKNPTGDNIVHLTSSPGIIKGNIITIGFAEHPTPARAAFASGLSKYSSAPGAETTALGYAQYANPFAEESPGSILSGELRGSRYFGQVEPLNYYPADWLERIQFARQYDPSIIPKLARTYSPSGIPDELRNFDWFYTTQAAHDGLHIQTPVPEYLGSGELETGTPATGKLMQGSKYDIITVRPNQGLFADTPLAKLFPTFVRGTYRTAYLLPSSWEEIAKAIKNSENPQIAQEFEAVKEPDLVKSLETKTPVPRQAGRAILTDPSGDYIYLVHEVGRPYFSLSGGGIKVGEDPLAATTREISEELNVKPEVTSKDPIVSNYLGEKKTFFTSGAPFRDNTDAWEMVLKKEPKPDMKEIDYVLKVPKEDLSKIKLDADSRYILKQAIPDLPDYVGVSMPQNVNKVVFDLDGTLIDQYGNLRPGARELLDSLREQGKQVALWTHSPYDRTAQILKNTHLDDYFDIKDPNQVVTREDYATDDNVHTFKDIRRIGGDVLIDDDPIQIKQQIAAGNYAIPTTKYYGGDSHDLFRIKDMLSTTPAEKTSEPLTPDTYKEIGAPDLSDINELHNAGIINDETYPKIAALYSSARIPYLIDYAISPYGSPSLTLSQNYYASPSTYISSAYASPLPSPSYSMPSYTSTYESPYASSSASPSYYASPSTSPSSSPSPSPSLSPSPSPTPSYSEYLYSPLRRFQNNMPPIYGAAPYYIEFETTPTAEYTQQRPLYAASVSSILFPSLNAIAAESYNPILAGALLRPIPTAAAPTVAQPLAMQSPTAVAAPQTTTAMPTTPIATSQASTGSVQPLDMPTTGPETPTELALAQAINANQAQLALNNGNNLYAEELNSALQKAEAQDIQARIAENFQNNLYMQSIYNTINSGLPPAMIESMLRNAYNQIIANTPAQIAPITAAEEPYASMADLRRYNQNPNMPVVYARMPLQEAMANPLAGMQLQAAQLQNTPITLPNINPLEIQTQAAQLQNVPTPNAIPALSSGMQTQAPQLQNMPLIPNTAPTLPKVSLAYINPASFVETSPYAELPPALMRIPA
ncbi:MAG: NIF family HAD-type phosphatase [Candidatus Micrarchaeaceae archaeon]